jgi:hypothetical protein
VSSFISRAMMVCSSARRHLLRLWLAPPDARPLPPCYAQRYRSVMPGDRGGVFSTDGQLRAPVDLDA